LLLKTRDPMVYDTKAIMQSHRFIFPGLEGSILHMKVAKSMEPLRSFRRYLSTYLAENQKNNA